MRKLALSDEILLTIEKPARYIGNEVNAVMKNKEELATIIVKKSLKILNIKVSNDIEHLLVQIFNSL